MADHRQPSGLDALRLSDRDVGNLLTVLERAGQSFDGADLRDDERFPYEDSPPLIARIHHPGGSMADYLVRARNISRTGIGFLHGVFVYTGTLCTLLIRRLDGRTAQMPGKVVRCRHVQGTVHEIGVRFDQPIELGDYLKTHVGKKQTIKRTGELPQFSGVVLYIEDAIDDRELMRFILGKLGVKAQMASRGTDGRRMAGQRLYDMIMVDMWLPDANGVTVAGELRRSGYPGPIVVVTADDAPQTRNDAIAQGCTFVLHKPIRMDCVIELFEAYLKRDSAADGGVKPLMSTEWSDASIRPLILGFLSRLEGQVRQIERYLTENDAKAVERLCHDLKGTAGGYGYPQISEVADQLVLLTAGGAPAEQVKTKMDELNRLAASACLIRRKVNSSG